MGLSVCDYQAGVPGTWKSAELGSVYITLPLGGRSPTLQHCSELEHRTPQRRLFLVGDTMNRWLHTFLHRFWRAFLTPTLAFPYGSKGSVCHEPTLQVTVGSSTLSGGEQMPQSLPHGGGVAGLPRELPRALRVSADFAGRPAATPFCSRPSVAPCGLQSLRHHATAPPHL